MSQAVIIRDPFDNDKIFYDLLTLLKNQGIKNIIDIPSSNDLETAKVFLDENEPCLYYPNIFIRHSVPVSNIIETHKKSDFDIIVDKRDLIMSFIPRKLFKVEKSTASFLIKYLKQYGKFTIVNNTPTYVKPDEKPIIFLYTHNRDTYLKLTLNSLDYSLIEKIPIKILLNNPTEKVKEVALEFAENKSYVEVLEVNENSFVTATNLLIQWFKPEKFILMEDDFIFPVTTREYFPNWPFQFLDRLNYFDVVAWGASLDNMSSPYFSSPRTPSEVKSHNDWELVYSESKHLLMAQALAVTTKFYIESGKKVKNNIYNCCFDCDLISSKKCTPSLRGYHIGWNQQMEGFPPLNDARWPKPVDTCHVTSLTTYESRVIKASDLWGIYD